MSDVSHGALRRMLVLETAAGEWFSKLSPEEQKAYKAKHPHSKMGGGGVSKPKANPNGGLTTMPDGSHKSSGEVDRAARAKGFASQSFAKAREHDTHANKNAQLGFDGAAENHAKAAMWHRSAGESYMKAHHAYTKGHDNKGSKFIGEGHTHKERGNAAARESSHDE